MIKRIPKVQIVINLPINIVRAIDTGIEHETWDSRSGAVRTMVSDYLGDNTLVIRMTPELVKEIDNYIKGGKWDSRANAARNIITDHLAKLRTIYP